MIFNKYIGNISIKRPFVFLCGPNGGDNQRNRRLILSKYLKNNIYKDNYYYSFPVIVDDIFNIIKLKEDTKLRNIKVTLLEEIVSAVSYRTYIFLDTMSTGYELGQFVNSRTKNKVRIFVDDQYGQRLYCPVGAYIKDSFDIDNKEIVYKAEYDSRGYIYFKGDDVPDEIKAAIDNDFKDYENRLDLPATSISQKDENTSSMIRYDYNDGGILNIYSDLKTIFYLMAAVAESRNISLTKNWDEKTEISVFNNLIDCLYSELIANVLSNSVNRNLLYNNPSVQINIENYNKNDDVLYHIFYLLRSIAIANKGFGSMKKAISDGDYSINHVYSATTMRFKSICNLTEHDMNIITDYIIGDKVKYVHEFTMPIHHKFKNIVTYNKNYYGNALRNVHKKINLGLSKILKTSDSSFAYKKDQNVLKCLNSSIDGIYFSKLDIKSYFNAIRYNKLISLFKETLMSDKLFCESIHDAPFILKCCFYKRKLPIGFITSPKLSDFYLYDIDEKMLSKGFCKYVRYADDILLSSVSDKGSVKNGKVFLSSLLKDRNLFLNEKCIDKSLINIGDSIGFLGSNIVRGHEANYLTISSKRIIKISKEFCNSLKLYESDLATKIHFNNIFGYVKMISPISYKKLRKLIFVKCKYLIP